MSCRYEEDYEYDEKRYEDINEMVHREGEIIEDFTGDEGFELLFTAVQHGASLDDFSEEVLTRFTPEQYYELCEAAVDASSLALTTDALRLIPDVKYRELYRRGMEDVDYWRVLYEHQSTIRSVIPDEEHCRIMVEFFLRQPEELNSFSHALDAPSLDEGSPKPCKEELDKRFRICREVVTQLPSALEWIYSGGSDDPYTAWCFSDEQFDELEDCARRSNGFSQDGTVTVSILETAGAA